MTDSFSREVSNGWGVAKVEVGEIRLASLKKGDDLYKTPEQSADWWYVVEEDGEHKEGVVLYIETPKRNYDIVISTETLRDMLFRVIREKAGKHVTIGVSVFPDPDAEDEEEFTDIFDLLLPSDTWTDV